MDPETEKLVLGGLLASGGGLVGALIGWVASWHVAKTTIRGQRILARDDAVRDFRTSQVQAYLGRVNRRVALYRDIGRAANRVGYGQRNSTDDRQALSVLIERLQTEEDLASDLAYRAVCDQEFQEAAAGFEAVDRRYDDMLDEYLGLLNMPEEVYESIVKLRPELESAALAVNQAATAFIFNVDPS
jgi:hypothetical protein